MRRALPRRIYVPGTFRWNDWALHQVGVRYKGNSSSAPNSPHKRSFLIAFSEFKQGQRFLGPRHAALDRYQGSDPALYRKAFELHTGNELEAFEALVEFIRNRYVLARAQLDAPGNRPAPKAMPAGPEPEGPSPGPPSADAPSDLQAVKVTRAGVELQWIDHAEGEVAFVVQRCTGAECTDFMNAIGQGGRILSDFGPQTHDHWHVGLAHRLGQERTVPGGVGIVDYRWHRRIPQHCQVFSPRAHDESRRVVPGHQEQR